jgi:3'(2'), 5'-bisphosphate nucleotidase
MNWSDLVSSVITIAEGAGAETLRFYKSADLKVDAKSDDSPVSAADLAAHHYIVDRLEGLIDGAEVISEESAEERGFAAPTSDRFWLVDPLDGTKEFINERDEFTVNIALIDQGRPIMGVVVAPALGKIWAGSPDGAFMQDVGGENRRDIRVREVPTSGLTVTASRSHADPAALEALLSGQKVNEVINAGSSLKFCRVAEGAADLYPRQGRTMEWDTAAGQAVAEAAGAAVLRLDDRAPLAYGKQGLDNPHFIVGLPNVVK